MPMHTTLFELYRIVIEMNLFYVIFFHPQKQLKFVSNFCILVRFICRYIIMLWENASVQSTFFKNIFFLYFSPNSDWPVWILLCMFNVDLCENRFKQISHPYGRSPVCVRWWMSRYGFLQNAAGHWSHWKGRLPTAHFFYIYFWVGVSKMF